jgi:hypothetical protein
MAISILNNNQIVYTRAFGYDNAESIFKELLEIAIADTYTPWKWEYYIPYQLRNE